LYVGLLVFILSAFLF